MEVGASMVWMGWRPARLSVHLPLLIISPMPHKIQNDDTTCFRREWVNVSFGTGSTG